ncbi:BglG family transcription antiterminator [Lactobacillus sp. ESL0791]|uniref:BglG family transcription antiterminator n=1 Tax=Lactobacillus sp. ESL0791 TaxID=2983234 RepID=UPI0023F87E97|nr:BglG family transcription antiterminator [Lactobacillus sp. ESL0791]MDF7638007.1 BglG family transcription antiterminator [Lactobacillus sp. ESL0791]
MNTRIQEIIFILLENPDIKVREMMKRLTLTRRQVNYAISLINNKLIDKGIEKIKRNSDGSFTFSSRIKELLSNYESENGEYNVKDRSVIIVMYLLFYPNYTSLDHLALLLDYSKTTIVNNLKEVSRMLREYNLKLNYDRKHGYIIKGDEEQVFRLATNLVQNNSSNLFQRAADADKLQQKVSKQAILLIMNVEEKFQASFSDKYFNNLKMMIQIIISRGMRGSNTDDYVDSFIGQTKEYQYLRKMPILKELDNAHVKWIALEILSANVFDKTGSEISSDEIALFGFVHQIVEGFKSKTLVNIDDQSHFEKRLLNHLRPACFRVRYHLPSIEFSTIGKFSNHRILENIIRELITPLESWLGTNFSDEEVQLLTYYFGYLLVKGNNTDKKKIIQYKAVVVCSNGIIMSNILLRILKNIFPEINFLFSMSDREFKESEKNFDVVFSTIPLETNLPNYVVKPNMNYSEKIALKYRVLNDLGLEKTDQQVENLINTVSKYAKINDAGKLRQGITKVLLSEQNITDDENTKINKFPDLLDYIKPNYIQVINQKNINWKDALFQALQPLVREKIVNDDYYTELIKQLSNRNNYSFLGTDMAIPHSSPENGVEGDGIGFLISRWPIKLPYGKEVRILAPIAFFYRDRYLKAINQLADLATNKAIIQKILNTRSSDQTYQVIRIYIERKNKGES